MYYFDVQMSDYFVFLPMNSHKGSIQEEEVSSWISVPALTIGHPCPLSASFSFKGFLLLAQFFVFVSMNCFTLSDQCGFKKWTESVNAIAFFSFWIYFYLSIFRVSFSCQIFHLLKINFCSFSPLSCNNCEAKTPPKLWAIITISSASAFSIKLS